MASKKQKDRKYQLAEELSEHFGNYSKMFLVDVDNVGSNQLHQIRIALRGKALIYCGKNTQMRRVIRELEKENPQLERVRNVLKLNLAIVFTNDNLSEIRDVIVDNKVAAPARAGQLAQCNVVVPAGNTGMEPTMTSFLQALNIPSKITKGSIEILSPVDLILQGERVEASQAALLEKLDIRPFSYGLVVRHVYDDGAMYDPAVLDITDEIILASFAAGIKNIAAIGIETDTPSVASVPYSILLAFKNLLAIAAETEYTFPEAAAMKEFLANPEAFASAAPAAGGSAAPAAAAVEAKQSSSDDGGGGGAMFADEDY
jgi:large subunit ribosomal protein LP0